jgi:hypothetical protein
MNFLRDDDVDEMVLSVGEWECPYVAAGHYTPHKLRVEPHIPAAMPCYQSIIQHK